MARLTIVAAFRGDVVERPACWGGSRVLLVRAAADLDSATEQAARAELREVCAAVGAAGWVVLYLGEQVFVGVRGLAVLLDTAEDARAHGRRLLVVGPPRGLRLMIDVLGLHARLPCAATAREAVCIIDGDRHVGTVGTAW
jgi:anti-anti-sigma factor